MEFSYELKVPKDRIAVLVGVKGSVKKKLESSLDVVVIIDSKEGNVVLQGEDSLKLIVANNIVKAIARGFNPDIAFKLLDEEYNFVIIDIVEFVGKSKSKLEQIRARVIGREGKARKTIEDITNSHIVVYGKTVSMIGKYPLLSLAQRAVESLLSGNKHGYVFKWLTEQVNKVLEAELGE